MSNRLRPRLTFANVVSCLALFVALGSGAYAANQLPKNSVGKRQLKKNAVTKVKIKKNSVNGPRVKNNSLTGADIKLSKLGTVPSAKNAATANTANTANLANNVLPAEPTHLVGAPGEPAFEGGSSNLGGAGEATGQPVGFYKDHDGIVHLQGLAKVGPGAPIPKIFTLPPGYRPASKTVILQIVLCIPTPEPCIKDGGEDEEDYSPLQIAGSNLDVEGIPFGGALISAPNRVVSLDGISFRAES